MRYQHRHYRVKPGQMDAFLEAFRTQIVPLREQFGFTVVGGWAFEDAEEFVWIVGHEDFEKADRRYYDSPERAAITPPPAEHLDGVVSVRMLGPSYDV